MRFSTLISNYEQSRVGPSPQLHFFFSSDSMLYLFLMSCVHRVTTRRARIGTKSRLVGSWPRALISHAKVKHAARFHLKKHQKYFFSANRVLYIKYDAKPQKQFSLQWHFKICDKTDLVILELDRFFGSSFVIQFHLRCMKCSF